MEDSVRAVEDRFVQHWGDMAALWGGSAAMGRTHGLLYITGRAMTAEEIMTRLQISRGGASMALCVAEQDPWTWFKRVIAERRRREVDPVVDAVVHCLALSQRAPADAADLAATQERLERLVEFMRLFCRAIDLFLALDREAIVNILSALGDQKPARAPKGRPGGRA
jgi:HTH-type transcriptional regulator, glycine betaine synthesis regulator